MRHTFWMTAVLVVVLTGLAGQARADSLADCGNIALGLEARCTLEPPVTCEQHCTPPAMVTSCATKLAYTCENVCKKTYTNEPITECSTKCVTDCQVNPGGFSCNLNCGAGCSGDCSTKCTGSTDSVQCMASCKASCSAYCDGGCKVVLPSMTCEDKCKNTCQTVWVAKENITCQLECQNKEFTTCQTTMVGGCKTSCQTNPNGGLFCDGQFIVNDSLEKCYNAIKNLKINLSGEFHFSVDTGGSVGCALGGAPRGVQWLLLLGFIPLILRPRRRS